MFLDYYSSTCLNSRRAITTRACLFAVHLRNEGLEVEVIVNAIFFFFFIVTYAKMLLRRVYTTLSLLFKFSCSITAT
jgi:predicted signal transduction protein with EAL and GGDEF domain